MPVLNEKEQKDLLSELDERVVAALDARTAKIRISDSETEALRTAIAQDVATPEEIASIRETKEQLERDIEAARAAVNEDSPTPGESKTIQDLFDRIDVLDAALYKHDPNY